MYYPVVVLPALFAIHPDRLGLLILILQLLKPQPCPGAYSRISVAVGERVFSWCRGGYQAWRGRRRTRNAKTKKLALVNGEGPEYSQLKCLLFCSGSSDDSVTDHQQVHWP